MGAHGGEGQTTTYSYAIGGYNGGGGGGSSYIGGVQNGSTQADVNEGNGKAVITLIRK